MIAVTNRRDLVFDDSRNVLYITTSDGKVQRYDDAAGSLLSAWTVGNALFGADLTPDGASLYAAENQTSGTQGFIRKVNLATGGVTDVPYTRDGGEVGAWDVAVLDNGKAYFTTQYSGSGWTPFRTITTATDSVEPISAYPGGVRQNTNLFRAADRSWLLLAEANASNGPLATYATATDTFSKIDSNWFNGNMAGAVNRDGSLASLQVSVTTINKTQSVFSTGLKAVENLAGIDGGVAFDPARDVLYGVNATTNEIVAYDSKTWRERYRLPVEEDVPTYADFNAGVMVVSGDGKKLFLSTPAGVRRYDLPQPTGAAQRITVSTPFPGYIPANTSGTVTVAVRDNFGDVATSYTGKVKLTSSDAAAVLPSEYTFTAADQGVKTFTVTLKTAGTQSLTAADAGNGLTTTQSGIQIYTGPPSLIPVANRRDVIIDATRNQVVMPAADGMVYRLDTASGVLLPPLRVGTTPLRGGDITPDGNFLYVADSIRGAVGGFFRKVNLNTGAVTNVLVPERAATWDVAVLANGTALANGMYEGSGDTPLYKIDLATDTMTKTFNVSAGSGENTNLFRGADRSVVLVSQGNISNGPLNIYTAATGTFVNSGSGWFNGSMAGAVSRDGKLLSLQVSVTTINKTQSVFDTTPRPVENLAGIDGGVAFDPLRDVLYGVNSTTNEVVVFDIKTWRERYRLPIGEDVPTYSDFNNGTISITSDAKALFLATPTGVRRIGLRLPTGTPDLLSITTPFPAFIKASTPGTFIVTVKDAFGDVITGYAGTVQFTSSDGTAGLPSNYTFTAADKGQRTFTANLATIGTHSITVTDAAHGLTTSQTGIQVHNGTGNFIPVPARSDLLMDPTRNQAIFTGSDGMVYRFDLATKTLLAPLPVGLKLYGADITPDGKYLYAGDAIRGAVGGFFRKVDLNTGLVTTVPVTERAGTWDVVIYGNGKAMVDGRVEGSGWTPLYDLDLATDTLTKRTGFPGSGGGASVRQDTYLVRSANRSKTWFAEQNISSGPFFWYSSTGDTFSKAFGIGGFFVTQPGVSRDGTLVAISAGGVRIYDQTGALVTTLVPAPGGGNYGTVFSPTVDELYVFDGSTSKVYVYDTTTWANTSSFLLGETTGASSAQGYGTGQMAVTPNGQYLFVSSPAGVRYFLVQTQVPTLDIDVPDNALAGKSVSFTVTAKTAFGATDPTFLGVVHFTSSDPQSGLPTDYTFTAGDAGVHTFTVTYGTLGVQSVTVVDLTGVYSADSDATTVTTVATKFLIAGFPVTVTAGDSKTFTVSAVDDFGNVATGYTGTIQFTSTDGQAGLPTVYTFTAGDLGVHTFSASLKTAGTQSLTASETSGPLTGTQSGIVVTPGAAAGFWFSGSTGPFTAGTPIPLTVTAKDLFGNVAIGYTGTVHFTSSDKQAGLPTDYAFTGTDAGAKSFDFALKTAGTQSITATDTVSASITGMQGGITITAGAAVALELSGLPAGVTAGDSKIVTVTARDNFGNVTTGFLGTVHFSSSDSQAGLPTDYTFVVGDNGVKTFTVTLKTSGAKSVTVDSAPTGLTPGSQTVTVAAGAAAKLEIQGPAATVTAGLLSLFIVNVRDAFGNLTNFAGQVTITTTDPEATAPSGLASNGQYGGSVTYRMAGPRMLTASVTGLPSVSANTTVTAAAASKLSVTGFPASIMSNTAGTVTVIARDPFGNVATGYTGTVHWSSSDGQAVFTDDYSFRPGDQGQKNFPVTLKTAGTQSITARDLAAPAITGTQTGITVTPGAAAQFVLSGLPTSTVAGSQVGFTITVRDASGNLATGFVGTVQFSSSDPQSTLPAAYTFTTTDAGQKAFTTVFRTAGTKSISVTGQGGTPPTATIATTVTPGLAAALAVSGQPATTPAGYDVSFTVTARDAFGNVATSFAGTVLLEGTDPQGSYPPAYAFQPADGGVKSFTATLRTAGPQTITAATPGFSLAPAATTVLAAEAIRFTVSGFPATIEAGTPAPVTVTAFDGYGNAATNYAGLVRITTTASDANLPPPATLTNGTGVFTVTLSSAGSQSIFATDTANSGLTGGQYNIVVTVPPSPPVVIGNREFAVGADAGGNGSAQLFNPDRSLRYTVTPFPGSTGGVRTAAADFTGDGIADLIAGTGPGRATRVIVLDGVTQRELFSVDPFEPSFSGGVYVAAGDLNGDGVPELAITPDEGGGPRARVFDGVGFVQLADFFGIEDLAFRGGARPAIGDITGDGKGDLVVAAGFGGGPRMGVFDGGKLAAEGRLPDQSASRWNTWKPFGDFLAFEPALRNGAFVAAGDLNGDGFAELFAGGGPGGGPRVTAFSGADLVNNLQTPLINFFAGNVDNRGGIRVAVKNLDNDTKADLVVGSGTGGGSRVTSYLATGLFAASPVAAFEFDAVPGFTGGVFVG